MESVTSGTSKWLVAAALFAFCVAPTFISYQPYLFAWDDSEYLLRAIKVSQAFWSGDVYGVKEAMVGNRPPVMTLLGLPWGPLASWDTAGNCFITLAAVISLLAALCLYLLMRIGVKPFFLVVASVCVFASLGPYPRGATAHDTATAFYADALLAWTSLAAVLLIPYEARTACPSIRGAVVRGILWASIFSLGAMTKISFFYFIVLIVPTLFLIRLLHGGSVSVDRDEVRLVIPKLNLRSAFAALIAFACWSAPSALYLTRYGQAFYYAWASSFGEFAGAYYIPLLQFLGKIIRESPGLVLSFVLTAAALIYVVIKRRLLRSWPDFLALLIMIGYGIVALRSHNREIRFAFPAIVALPFLTAMLMSGEGHPVPGRTTALAAGVAFCGLLAAAVPTGHRADIESLSRADAVLLQAARCKAKRIMLATDSPTLNANLMELAIELSASGASVHTLAYQDGKPIEEAFRLMSESDQVVFQDGDALSPPWTNQRVSEYERYIRQGGSVPIRVGDDTSVYSIRCKPAA